MAEAERTEVTPEENGPYIVKGSFSVVLSDGRVLQTNGEAWLCRCGGSKTKPFCDDTHLSNGFHSSNDEMAANAEAPAAETNGAGYQAVASADDLPEGEIRGVEVNGRAIVIGRVNGQVYAIDGICSHQFARLAEGDLDGNIVMCPLHNSGFDIRTGAAARLPAQNPVPTYEVKVEDGQIQVSRQPRSQGG